MMPLRRLATRVALVTALAAAPGVTRAQSPTSDEAAAALRKSVEFFDREVSVSGGYLWRYAADLSRGEGEGRASRTTAWVQPPGTPSVGSALLDAFKRTGDDFLATAARRTALALVAGQLESGGWDYRIEFDPADRRRHAYYRDSPRGSRNVTTLDDDTTQSALRFLMRVDRLGAGPGAVETADAVQRALTALLDAQYPNGAWPQRFSEPPKPDRFPVVKASYPESWPREYPGEPYHEHYTLNDNTLSDMISTMLMAARLYGDERYQSAAERAGDFLVLAQMPDPQPAWAQQYDARMHPAWARKFEPPAVTGGESQQVLRILMELYRQTGKRKYLEPIPRALAYLNASRLSNGQLARFYELETNRPLYFTRQYVLTYQDSDLPTHYGFKVDSRLDAIEAQFRTLPDVDPRQKTGLPPVGDSPPRLTQALARQAAAAIAAMDARGAWVEPGRLAQDGDDDRATGIIDCRTFIRNVETLSRFIEATR